TFFILRRWTVSRRKLQALMRQVWIPAVLMLGTWGMFGVLSLIDPWLKVHRVDVTIAILGLGCGGVLLTMAGHAMTLRRDKAYYRVATRSLAISREAISADFQKFESSRYRLRYV